AYCLLLTGYVVTRHITNTLGLAVRRPTAAAERADTSFVSPRAPRPRSRPDRWRAAGVFGRRDLELPGWDAAVRSVSQPRRGRADQSTLSAGSNRNTGLLRARAGPGCRYSIE